MYEAVYYNGYDSPPSYYLLGSVEGDTPEQALRDNLMELTSMVRDLLLLGPADFDDESIQVDIYVIRADGLVSVREAMKTL